MVLFGRGWTSPPHPALRAASCSRCGKPISRPFGPWKSGRCLAAGTLHPPQAALCPHAPSSGPAGPPSPRGEGWGGICFALPFTRRWRVWLPCSGRRVVGPYGVIIAASLFFVGALHEAPACPAAMMIKGIVGLAMGTLFSVGAGLCSALLSSIVRPRAEQRQRHPAKNEQLVEPVPLG